jgi:glycosyltransferase involved in cell wall biosynthesis
MPQDPLHLLVIETRFPGRLGAVADWMVRKRGCRATFFCHQVDPAPLWPEGAGKGLEVVQFNVGGVAKEATVAWPRQLERGLCHAYGAWEVVENKRIRPVDVILGRSNGLGSTLFAPVSYPRVPIVNWFDYFYQAKTMDLAEEDAPALPAEYLHWRRSANAMDLLDLENGVVPWIGTAWQRDLYPPEYRDDFFVLHDGVDTRRFKPREAKSRSIGGREIPEGTRVVTFVSSNLDRLRGFDRFYRLAARVMTERSDVLFVAIGNPIVGRTADVRFHGQNYLDTLANESPLPDPSRLWTPGTVPPGVVAEALAASDLHLVPSRAYPIARSLLEAMASSAVVLAWDAPPIQEVLKSGENAVIVQDEEEAERKALEILGDPNEFRPIGEAARRTILDRFDRDESLSNLALKLNELVHGTPDRV